MSNMCIITETLCVGARGGVKGMQGGKRGGGSDELGPVYIM